MRDALPIGGAHEAEAVFEELEPVLDAELEKVQIRERHGRSLVGPIEERIEYPDHRPPLEEPRGAALAFEPQAALPREEDVLGLLALGEESLTGRDVLFVDDGRQAVDDPGLEIGCAARQDRQKELARSALQARVGHARLVYRAGSAC